MQLKYNGMIYVVSSSALRNFFFNNVSVPELVRAKCNCYKPIKHSFYTNPNENTNLVYINLQSDISFFYDAQALKDNCKVIWTRATCLGYYTSSNKQTIKWLVFKRSNSLKCLKLASYRWFIGGKIVYDDLYVMVD